MFISDSIKVQHELFVSGHNGSSPFDIIFTILPVVPGAALAISYTYNNVILRLVGEFIFCILPLILSLTYMNGAIIEMNAIMILLFFMRITYLSKRRDEEIISHKLEKASRLNYLTACRATVNLVTIISILAVDFHIYSRRFAKTEKYGYSLMDAGAASYVFMNAITDCKRKKIGSHIIRDSAILLILGFLRLLAVSYTHYQHHVTEYGLHCNFFFTLACIKIVCCWVPLISINYKVAMGTMLALIHFSNLNSGLGPWTLSEEPRDNFIAANREWIVSMPGYIEIYMFGAAVGEYMFSRNSTAVSLAKLALVPLSLLSIMDIFLYLHPSRRLANPSFMLWIVGFFITCLTTYKSVESLWPQKTTCLIFEAINSYPLVFFLLGNLFTGTINIICNTLDINNFNAFLIIVIYTIVLISAVVILYLRKEKHKEQKE